MFTTTSTAIKKTTKLSQRIGKKSVVVQCISHRQQQPQQKQIQQQQQQQQQHQLQQFTRSCTTATITTLNQQKLCQYRLKNNNNINFILQNYVNYNHNVLIVKRNFAIIRRRRGRGGQQDQPTEQQLQQQQQQSQKTSLINPLLRNNDNDSNDIDVEFDATIDDYENDNDDTTRMFTFNRPGLLVDKTIFEVESTKEINKLIKALEPLQYYNDIFIVEQSYTDSIGPCITIDIGPIHGKYTIQFDIYNTLQLQLISPLSGHYNYSCYINIDSNTTIGTTDSTTTTTSSSNSEWLSTIDGHHFEGMLVRDLIRQIQGVPNL